MKTFSHYALTLLLAVASLDAPIAVGQSIPKPASNRQGGELSLTELVGRHPLVFEGHVVGQRSFWNASHTKILTATTIEVFTVFKGNVGPTMEIITEGGVVGEEGMGVFDGDQPALGKSSAGLFFAQPYSKNDLAANASAAPAVEVNAGAQGYWMYQRPARATQTVAITPYRVYDDIPALVQAPIAAAAGQTPRVLKSFDARRFDPFAATAPPQQKVTTPVAPQKKTASQTGAEAAAAPNSPTAAPVITGFSPTSIKAGTFDILTINGTDFGTAKPRVFFTSSNNDASIECPPENIFSFTNTIIQLYVPSNDGTNPPFGISAGTGPIYVESNNIRSNVPNTDITIIRSETTYNDPLITPTAYRQTRLVSANGAGGYTFKYDQNIYNTPEAVRLIEAALQKWRCETLVNIGDDVSAATPYVQGTPECNISFAPSGTMGARLMSTYGYFRTCSNSATNGRFVYTTAMDIQINPDKFWNYSLEGDPYSADEYDFKTSILHELGHAIGLQHVKDQSKLMYNFLGPRQARYYLSAEPEIGGGANILDRSTRQQTCTSNSYTAMQALTTRKC
ncbi:matrixin family metalloprotease [Hymenobacter endophyticus]|uniref:Matrixin family metalloprotease n=1 Tax=Hymenobacter endophyticus TaxID=3076335 RepID=A0ABU3TMC1_9BACT|nr:matrixin family metalloprotease [Hymenobacter endophyticus]MDU0372345.1 matrixin family metalloprotease [Hymenobacter endophyticus]